MKTILIAGINGDIGKEFAKRLLGQGKLYGLSRKETPLIGLQYHHIQADLLKPNEIKTAFEKIEPSEELVYIHLPGKFQCNGKAYIAQSNHCHCLLLFNKFLDHCTLLLGIFSKGMKITLQSNGTCISYIVNCLN